MRPNCPKTVLSSIAHSLIHIAFCLHDVFFTASVQPQGSGLAPPYNPEAQTPQDVYDINNSIHCNIIYNHSVFLMRSGFAGVRPCI